MERKERIGEGVSEGVSEGSARAPRSAYRSRSPWPPTRAAKRWPLPLTLPLTPTLTGGWVIGNGLRLLAKQSDFEALDRLARERRFGTGRQMIVLALGRMKDPRAIDTLLGLLDDPQVAMTAIMALGKLKAQGARAQVAEFLDDPNPDFRREAKRTLAAIDKVRGKRGER